MHGPKWPFLLACGPGVVVVQCWDRLCIRSSASYKGDSTRFSLNLESWKRGLNGVVSGYPTFTNIPQVDGLSTDPREMGRHITILQFSFMKILVVCCSYLKFTKAMTNTI